MGRIYGLPIPAYSDKIGEDKVYVFVVNRQQAPLMPTTPARARHWILSGRATPFWRKGVFCIRMNEPVGTEVQRVAIGVDPGSKKEAITVQSTAHTYLHLQLDAVTWVRTAIETRREMRRARRFRKTPYRKCRWNRKIGQLAPSTKARWAWKLRILNWLDGLIPITDVVVEDIKATTKIGQRHWNRAFSPLEVGKSWFYSKIEARWQLHILEGHETARLRQLLGLKKSSKKLSEKFEAHCVDSFVLAYTMVGGDLEHREMLLISPIRLHRRQLHALQPSKGGKRRNYGGTRSLGLKRGSLVEHTEYGITHVGGTTGKRISLHEVSSGKRLTQQAKLSDLRFKSYNSWRAHSPHG